VGKGSATALLRKKGAGKRGNGPAPTIPKEKTDSFRRKGEMTFQGRKKKKKKEGAERHKTPNTTKGEGSAGGKKGPKKIFNYEKRPPP